jgi:hypothetical protein
MPHQRGTKTNRRSLQADGYDSICLVCAQTVASGVKTEEELTKFELLHECLVTMRNSPQFMHTV